jgi:hypothetical protein
LELGSLEGVKQQLLVGGGVGRGGTAKCELYRLVERERQSSPLVCRAARML